MRQLTMSTEDGTPYTRSPAVEEQIAETLCWSDSDVPAKRKSLLNEVLVYNIRRFRERDDYICGMLLRELGQRTSRIVSAAICGVDPLGKADIAMQVEVEVLELAIAPEPSRKSEFLEVAFTQAVKRRAINLRERLKTTVQGHPAATSPILYRILTSRRKSGNARSNSSPTAARAPKRLWPRSRTSSSATRRTRSSALRSRGRMAGFCSRSAFTSWTVGRFGLPIQTCPPLPGILD